MNAHRTAATPPKRRCVPCGVPSPAQRRAAVMEGARLLEAMAKVYDGDAAKPGPRALWRRRAREARRYARMLRALKFF